MSYAAAQSAKQAFFADKAKMDSLMAGGVDATNEWRAIVAGLSAQPAAPADPREAAAEHLNACAGYNLSEEVLQEFVENRPVSPLEQHYAQSKFEEMKQDREWFARYQRGEIQARREMALVQSILSRPVKDEPQPQS
jgi:hypothetical protein